VVEGGRCVDVKRYVVTTFDGTMILICADRHRRYDDLDVFEARSVDPAADTTHRWLTVSALRRTDVRRVQRFTVSMPEQDFGSDNP
jgi:hypothetical protein